MATRAKKSAPKKRVSTPSKTGAGAATAERSKDAAKPTFGKAAPRKVTPAQTAKPAPKTAQSAKNGGGTSLAARIAQIATGAVMAVVKGAASLVGKPKAK